MDMLANPGLAAATTRLAIPLFVISLVALALFFGGAGAYWGPINDVAIAFALLLLIPAVLAVGSAAGATSGAWFQVLGWLAILGILIAAGGQLLLVAGAIPLSVTFVTGGVGFLPVLVWVGALGVVAINGGVTTPLVGGWALAFVGLAVVALVLAQFLPLDAAGLTVALGTPITVGFVGWAWTLSGWLAARA